MSARGTLGSVEAYSIACIVYHQHERTAAGAILDERHHEPHGFNAQKHSDDLLSYSWGRIGHHCIVIVSISASIQQSTNTEVIVRCLRASLPHIRLGLILGTASGLPGERINRNGESVSRRDIRLGDVVVATHCSGADSICSGVVQFDSDATGDHPSLERRVDLPDMPVILRSALMTLQSEHELDGSKVSEIIETTFQRFPNITKTYRNPGIEMEWDEQESDSESDSDDESSFTPDRLFKASYVHAGGDNCGSCQSSEEVKRKKRKIAGPKIHFGTAILFKAAVKTASVRDRIVEMLEERSINALCIDSETFGLPEDFPCLLIKGICNYGDEHRSDRWQKFAALSAAAFARELLRFVGVADVERLPRHGGLLKQIH